MSFKYINEDSIEPELKCPICFDPFVNPKCHIDCGIIFCEKCIKTNRCSICKKSNTNYRTIIEKPLLNMIKKLKVECNYCNEIFVNEVYKNHSCPNQIIKCKYNCKYEKERKYINKHEKKCIERIINCELCDIQIKYKE